MEIPFLVLHGTDDVITSPEFSKILYEVSASKDKTIHLLPEYWHRIFDEDGK